MQAFSQLLDALYFTRSTTQKTRLLHDYLRHTPDPDRGYAVAIIAGELSFPSFKRSLTKELLLERVDATLFALAYDYVGELSETAAHLWPSLPDNSVRLSLPSLSELVQQLQEQDKSSLRPLLCQWLDDASASERWALLKMASGGLRIGISARALKKMLASYGNKEVQEIEALWHQLAPPYTDLLHWLEGKAEKPQVKERVSFYPVMLAHPLEEEMLERITPGQFQAEWKYDGIRCQLVMQPYGKGLFSRTGDRIDSSFPDLLQHCSGHAILDGELVVHQHGALASFNELQQRLGRLKPSKALMERLPAQMIVYDALMLDGESLVELPLDIRRQRLATWLQHHPQARLHPSPLVDFTDATDLRQIHEQATERGGALVEGLMLKDKQSPYVSGRPKGAWYKWKHAPKMIDAVVMYAQRGHGKRSSLYSDYTYGLWQDGQLLPIGKAYSGFTDEELRRLDKWVREHTTGRFGPVREVEKSLVLEIAFDHVQLSKRHKSGVALRFPRIHRIRWDKPAAEANQLADLQAMITR